MDPIVFIIIAVVVYSFFRPKNKPERTTGPTARPQQQYPEQYPEQQRERGILSDLEDILREAQAKTEEASSPVPNRPIERSASNTRPASEARFPSQMKATSEKRSFSDPRTLTPKKPAAKRTAIGDDYGNQEPQSMHKIEADRKGLILGRASIVQGFIWSQVLGEPVSKRSPARSRRRVT